MKGVVLAGHVSIDLILEMENGKDPNDFFHTGVLQRVEKTNFYTGGSVLNTGLALHKLGIPIEVSGVIGDDEFGRNLLSLLEQYDAKVKQGITVKKGGVTPYTLVMNFPGYDRIFLYLPGTNDTFCEEDVHLEHIDKNQYKIFHFGYPPLMRQMYQQGGDALVEIFKRAKKYGFVTSMDMAYPPPDSEAEQADWLSILHRVLPYVDVFIPSYDEILAMTGREKDTNHDKPDIDLLREFTSLFIDFGCSIVGIKLGEYGLYVRTSNDVDEISDQLSLNHEDWSNRELWSACYQTQVVGTTGSGDSTIAGFLATILEGGSPILAIQTAVGTGAMNVEAVDGTSGIKSLEILHDRLENGWKKHNREPVFNQWRNIENMDIKLGEMDQKFREGKHV